MPYSFRTEDLAGHAGVRSAHPQYVAHPRFAQQVGSFLTRNVGGLAIRQVSPPGEANATWESLSSGTPDWSRYTSVLDPLAAPLLLAGWALVNADTERDPDFGCSLSWSGTPWRSRSSTTGRLTSSSVTRTIPSTTRRRTILLTPCSQSRARRRTRPPSGTAQAVGFACGRADAGRYRRVVTIGVWSLIDSEASVEIVVHSAARSARSGVANTKSVCVAGLSS